MEVREVTLSYRLSQWAEIIQERARSGEIVEAFCIRKGISKHKYYYWQQKLRKVAGEQMSKLDSQATELSVRGFTEVSLSEAMKSTTTAESNQVCIETLSCRITAGSSYPSETLVAMLREVLRP